MATLAAGSERRLPADLNAETYPYEVVQHLLDQTVTLAFYATPVPRHFEDAVLRPAQPDDFFGINGGYGLGFACDLRAFESIPSIGATGRPFLVSQAAGDRVGRFTCVALFSRDGGPRRWRPGEEPPPAISDRWRSQTCVLMDPSFDFGSDGIAGFGIGRTYPMHAPGAPALLFGGVGNLTEGRGMFRGHVASVSLCGTITSELGFEGVITCRVVDPQGDLRSDAEPPELEPSLVPRGSGTFVLMRGVKKDRTVRTTFGPKPAPDLDSLVTPSEMRTVRFGFSRDGRAPEATMSVGATIARMTADVRFSLSAPPGTADAPTPFTTIERYEFVSGGGAREIGRIQAGVTDGIAFGLQFPSAPGQPGVRFAGFGPIAGGSGPFEGVRGLLTVNSVIGIAPHALSLTHVLHLFDPAGAWRAG
jgi:hypothetical protein